jgi:hypothetical protein
MVAAQRAARPAQEGTEASLDARERGVSTHGSFKRLTDTPMEQRGLWWRIKVFSAIALCWVMAAYHWLFALADRIATGCPPYVVSPPRHNRPSVWAPGRFAGV